MSKRVLIIDDEEDVVFYLRALLEDNGYETHTAKNSAEGMKLIQKIHPHLICLDILMPGQSGISLYSKLSGDDGLKNIPVLIVSGLNLSRATGEMEKILQGIAPSAIIEKPVHPEEFVSTVRKLIQ